MKNYFIYITLLFATTALAQQKIFLPKVTKISAKKYADAEVNYRQSQAQLAKMQKLLII
jgi:hypothetical protein